VGELDCGGIESRASGRVKPDVLLEAVLSSTGRMEKFLGAGSSASFSSYTTLCVKYLSIMAEECKMEEKREVVRNLDH
jgi:hypothetical protein